VRPDATHEIDEKRIQHVVRQLLGRAVQEGASDIHLLPQPGALNVYFRIEGILQPRPAIHAAFQTHITSLLKVQGGMDISEKRRAQDGAFTVKLGEKPVRFRVSSLPTEFGEKLVLRVLGGEALARRLDELGMDAPSVEVVRRLVLRPNGLVLVSGPTGSGKTSSLYALLRELVGRQLSIVTLEDPIEYRFQGIAQSQTNPGVGHTFTDGLRAILRQDPDVIMVGEIRDLETARIAFKAALTGHMVISSLHTSSAAETIVRLVDMGLERYVVASALRGIVAQRLVRVLCTWCRRKVAVSDALAPHGEAVARQLVPLLRGHSVYQAAGCKACSGTGYKGRTGIFELVTNDPGLSRLIRQEVASQEDYLAHMAKAGLPTLWQVGVQRVLAGETTIDELLRVT
jgi:type II secretory ATPase GspE/PulE/Tfp pilus assembly ATPase PilB-like protein